MQKGGGREEERMQMQEVLLVMMRVNANCQADRANVEGSLFFFFFWEGHIRTINIHKPPT